MKLFIKEIDQKFALEILGWNYEAPYDIYNNEINSESISEMLDNPYYVVLDENSALVGFFCYGESAQVPIGAQFGAYNEKFIDVGIGMNPTLTGQGNGYRFSSYILQHLQGIFPLTPIRLTVAKFNKRAIHLYEKLGFEKKMEFNRETVEFITMVL